uniref:Uncharacterized protein n=1 Tax=Aegilops tauschii subsp. strangulata TaxID=200361 RepID=A0A452ZF04_AEGTS
MEVKLKDLVPAATNTVNTTFIVVDKAPRPAHANAHGREETCPSLVADETAAVHFLLWGTECDAFESGDIVRLTSGIFSYHRGNNLFLRAGKRGRMEKVGEFTMMFVETPNMSELPVLEKAYSCPWTILAQPYCLPFAVFILQVIVNLLYSDTLKSQTKSQVLISPSDLICNIFLIFHLSILD